WGAAVLGSYSRAYQLMTLPTENLNAAIGGVAFSAIANLDGDAVRLKRCFLTGYRQFLSLALPVPVACALFADDIVRGMLGPQWHDAAVTFRLLAPTAAVFILINPFGWFMQATGRAERSLRMAFVIAAGLAVAYSIGIAGGASGMAAAFSIAMV